MDRQLTKDEINSQKRKIILRIASIITMLAIAGTVILLCTRNTVKESALKFGTVERGNLETSVTATGKVAPAFEEIIVSPVAARIVEVYQRSGDTVNSGAPLLRLDLEAVREETERLADSRQKQVLAVKQQILANETQLTRLEMEIKVKKMNVGRLEAELAAERRLDSIGSGTGDRVRQAELDWRTASIELEQLRTQLKNESKSLESNLQSLRLDLSITDRMYRQQKRTLEEARLLSPRKATLTYINTAVGSLVAAGEKVASIADLTDFKIDAEIAESNGRFLTPGGKAFVRIAGKVQPGTITSVSPLSVHGAVSFSVILDSASTVALRPGLQAEVGVVRDFKQDILHIPFGRYYNGTGAHEMYVRNGDEVEKRIVMLGDANYDYVEVTGGLKVGETVVISGLDGFNGNKYILK